MVSIFCRLMSLTYCMSLSYTFRLKYINNYFKSINFRPKMEKMLRHLRILRMSVPLFAAAATEPRLKTRSVATLALKFTNCTGNTLKGSTTLQTIASKPLRLEGNSPGHITCLCKSFTAYLHHERLITPCLSYNYYFSTCH